MQVAWPYNNCHLHPLPASQSPVYHSRHKLESDSNHVYFGCTNKLLVTIDVKIQILSSEFLAGNRTKGGLEQPGELWNFGPATWTLHHFPAVLTHSNNDAE
jgi:hypothetical protein